MNKRIYSIFTVLSVLFIINNSIISFAHSYSHDSFDIELVDLLNIYNSSLTFYISDDGAATVMYTVSGFSDSKKIVVKTYIERRTLGVFWSKIETGNDETEWTDVSNDSFMSNSHSVTVRENGTYRATMIIYVDGNSFTKTAGFEFKKSKSLGDVNFDGSVTAADARLILRYSALLERFSSAQKNRADMNGDDKVNAADARIALRTSAKL